MYCQFTKENVWWYIYNCSVRIFAEIDDVMIGLCKDFGMEIPVWNLNRFVKVKVDEIKQRDDMWACTISWCIGEKLLKINSYGGCKAAEKFRRDAYMLNIVSKW